jgi:hypothetical protein
MSGRPPLTDGRSYTRDDLRRQLAWFEDIYGMTSAEHCDRRDDWLTDRGPHPIPFRRYHSAQWDDYFHEWREMGEPGNPT